MEGVLALVVVAVVVAGAAALPPRNLTAPKINPGCSECPEPWLVVTAGVGANNTLHHLWGTKGSLSFLVAAGTGGPDVTVDWPAFRNSSSETITFQKDPSHVFGLVIPSLVLYNDVNDEGAFKGQNESLRVPISDFTWSAEVQSSSPQRVSVVLQTTHYQNILLPNDTKILVQMSAYGEDGRSGVLPHLLYTPDSAQLDLILDNLNLNLTDNRTEEWKKTRLGLDVMVFSTETEEKEKGDLGIKFLTQKSLDDEHTPGVFNLDQLTTAGARAESKAGGYLQWRPVSYLGSDRDVRSATTPNLNTSLPGLLNLTDPLKESLAYAVLGDNLILPGAAVTSVVSFGQPEDGFYKSHNYSTWTVGIGEGVPPRETFSTMIVVAISIAVLLPCFMLLAGCVGLVACRYRRQRSSASLLISSE